MKPELRSSALTTPRPIIAMGREFVSHLGFHRDAVSVSEDRIRSVAQTLGLPDQLEMLPEVQAIMASV